MEVVRLAGRLIKARGIGGSASQCRRWAVKNVDDHNTVVWGCTFVGSGVVTGIGSAIILASTISEYSPGWLWGTIGFWGLLFLACMAAAYDNSCPSCTALWARVEIGRHVTDSHIEYVDVERTKEVRDAKGSLIAVEKYVERVPVNRTTYHHDFQCRYCGHTWFGSSTV